MNRPYIYSRTTTITHDTWFGGIHATRQNSFPCNSFLTVAQSWQDTAKHNNIIKGSIHSTACFLSNGTPGILGRPENYFCFQVRPPLTQSGTRRGTTFFEIRWFSEPCCVAKSLKRVMFIKTYAIEDLYIFYVYIFLVTRNSVSHVIQ